MAKEYNVEDYHVDFSNHPNLSDHEKTYLENIQQSYRPMERVDYLMEYRYFGKITSDEFEKMTGMPYIF